MKSKSMERFVALLMTALLLTSFVPAMAEEAAALDDSVLFEWVMGLDAQPQTLDKQLSNNELAALRNFYPVDVSAYSGHLKSSMSKSVDPYAEKSNFGDLWEYAFFYIRNSEGKVDQACLGTLLMIKNDVILLATDSSDYAQIVDGAVQGGLTREEAVSRLSKMITVALPDGEDSFCNLQCDGLVLSEHLPLAYIIIKVKDDLGDYFAENPAGGTQECVGYAVNANEELGLMGDSMIPADGGRFTLKGSPFLKGSPVFSADLKNSSYSTPAIGIQCDDGYVYPALQAVNTLFTEIKGDDEPAEAATPEPTPVTPEPTDTVTPEPTATPTQETGEEIVAPIVSEDPPEPSDDPTAVPTSEGESEQDDRGHFSGLLQKDEVRYGLFAAVVMIVLLAIRARRRKTAPKTDANVAEKVSVVPAKVATPEPSQTLVSSANDAATRQVEIIDEKPAVSICCLSGTLAGASFTLSNKVYIGRDKRSCGIIFPDNEPGISGLHCSVAPSPEGNALILTDEGSSHGTFVNGSRLTVGRPVRLKNGASFYLGSERNAFSVIIENKTKE